MSLKTNEEPERIPWDPAFKQLMVDTLKTLGLKVIRDHKLGELPLEADLVIVCPEDLSGEWLDSPIWQYFCDQNLVEFKSINDDIRFGDFEILLAYTLHYRAKEKIGYGTQLASWIIVPDQNKQLKAALKHYQITLTEILPGFWSGQTLFPLFVVAYNRLPFELPYSALKIFIKSGKPVQKVFRAVLESEKRPEWVQAFLSAMDLIHPLDAKEVLEQMSLATERQELHKKMLEIVKDDVEKQVAEGEQKVLREMAHKTREMAREMLADGIPLDRISRYTGLPAKEIKKLGKKTSTPN